MSNDQTTPERRGSRQELTRRPRVKGEKRAALKKALADGYAADNSIRALAAEHDMSYGLTRTLLLDAGVTLRPRARRPRKAAGQ
ncbi:helix-turn-helix domain-containing protein [Streptomyces sp. NPDC003038]|uniref:helix-turn-helix domain-containing protein n=1 Tax=unclassified Streptomyces TaxID=2593676 RepID=UPI0033BADD7E